MSNENIIQAVEALELTMYDILYDVDINGVKADTVAEIEINSTHTFRIEAEYRLGGTGHILELQRHHSFVEFLEADFSASEEIDEPEFIFDGNTIINNENIASFNNIADNIIIDGNYKEREILAKLLEERLNTLLSIAEEENFEEFIDEN